MPNPRDMDDDGTVDRDALWLDAIDAEERGDRQETLRICKDLVVAEPENSDAWMTCLLYTSDAADE